MRKPLFFLGALWLILAATIVVTQLLNPAPITVAWQTETEVNTAGFNVYRARSADGPFTQLNERLIPTKGSATTGAAYEYIDDTVEPGQRYYYRLEDVEIDNSSAQHALVDETAAPLLPWWSLIISAAAALIGLFLLARTRRPLNGDEVNARQS